MSEFTEDLQVFDAEPTQIVAAQGGQAMVQMRSSFMTAVRVERPRNLPEVQKKLMEEARLAGETFFYGWGAGKDRVEGKSQALAHAALRCWGNCAVEFGPVQEITDSWIFTAYFIDLESGTTLARPFRMSKSWKVYGKFDEHRKADIRFQIGASKAARNVILKALPQWLTDRAIENAKAGVREGISKFIERKGLAAAQDAAVKRLEQFGVPEAAVMKRFEIADRKALDLDKLVLIQGDIKAIDTGEARPEDLYPAGEGPKKSDFGEPTAKAPKQAAPEPTSGPEPVVNPDPAPEEPRMAASESGAFAKELKRYGALDAFVQEHGPVTDWPASLADTCNAAIRAAAEKARAK